jgi:hypothetical protein
MNYIKLKSLSYYTFIILLTTLSSCSFFYSNSEDQEGARQTVAQVVAQYLQFSFLARMPAVDSSISVTDFLENQHITYDEYEYRIVRLSRRWTIEENPLIQLKIQEINLDGDNAEATLKRVGDNFPELKFKLRWTGSSWRIFDDNIFGKDELYEKGK